MLLPNTLDNENLQMNLSDLLENETADNSFRYMTDDTLTHS